MKLLVAAIAASIAFISPATAATIFATSAVIVQDGPRGTSNNRDNINNALGVTDGKFFELGYEAIVDFFFARDFRSSGAVVEITYTNNPASYPEAVIVQVGTTTGGVFTLGKTADPNPLTNFGSGVFTFAGGPFNTVRLIDVTREIFPTGAGSTGNSGGFDVDSISVSAVPLPATALLLVGGIAGLGALRRRRRT